MKNSKLKFIEYVQNMSRSKRFGKFVLIVMFSSCSVYSCMFGVGLLVDKTTKKLFFFCQRIKGGNVILKRHQKLIHPNFSLFVVFLSYKNILSFLNSTNSVCYKRRRIHQRKLCSTNNAQHLFSYILLHRTCAMINISRYCHNINQLFVYFCSQAFLPCHAS